MCVQPQPAPDDRKRRRTDRDGAGDALGFDTRRVEKDVGRTVSRSGTPGEIVEVRLTKLVSDVRQQRIGPVPAREVIGHQASNIDNIGLGELSPGNTQQIEFHRRRARTDEMIDALKVCPKRSQHLWLGGWQCLVHVFIREPADTQGSKEPVRFYEFPAQPSVSFSVRFQ